MITKKQLLENQDCLYDITTDLRYSLRELSRELEELAKNVKKLEKSKTLKVKVKGTPGRPSKVAVTAKKPVRDASGKFAKKK